jgi:hypothetical protein
VKSQLARDHAGIPHRVEVSPRVGLIATSTKADTVDPSRYRRSIWSGVSVWLRDLDAKSLRGVPQSSVIAVKTLEILTQAHDGCQVQGVE